MGYFRDLLSCSRNAAYNCITRNTYLFFVLCLGLSSCGKEPVAPSSSGVGGTTSGSVASFKKIPLPTVNINALIIPVLSDFYVTNKGPYVQIQNTNQQRWSVYKYHGGTGASAWSSFNPSFKSKDFIPVSFEFEKENEFGIYWTEIGEKYGMYNLNNGIPSFEFDAPLLPLGPGAFSKVLSAQKGFHRLWGISGNEVWAESATASPKTFRKVATIPVDIASFDYVNRVFADPDTETVLWVATLGKLYQISSVGSGASSAGGIVNFWTFSPAGSTELITTLLKVDGALVVQVANKVYRLDGTTFKKLGTLNISQTATSNIATNGSTIYASDGTYYKASTNTWESFIGNGKNLSATDQSRYDELKGYCAAGSPIGVLKGSSQGPVYLLGLTELIEIAPSL